MAPRLSSVVRREVIRLAAAGRTYREIIDEAGVSMGSVTNITKPLGGVIRPEMWCPSSARLSLDDRVNIKVWLEAGESFAEIARRLGRVTSTIDRRLSTVCGYYRRVQGIIATSEADRHGSGLLWWRWR